MPVVVEPVLQSKVTEALAKDLGRGMARLDPADMARLGVAIGDVVAIAGARRTVARLSPTYRAHRGQGRVLIDGVVRANAGAALGQDVEIRRAEARRADRVVLGPLSNAAGERDLARWLDGLPVVSGDRVRVGVLGCRPAEFTIGRTVPGGPVVIETTTTLELAGTAGDGRGPLATAPGPPLSYEEIGGLRRELDKVREVVELPLRHPEVFERLGIDPPRGVLLHGPPGCGKTLIARAVAHETEARFFSVNGPEIIHKYYGESEAHLRELFAEAARQAPSILFFDEIDAIAPRRERVFGDVEKRVVSQLLTLMDGLAPRAGVIVLAATNLPDALDPALRRPGRFDREIRISAPDRDGREEILSIQSRRMPLAGGVDLPRLAAITRGFVGADLAALCREAAMTCLRRALPGPGLGAGRLPSERVEALEVRMDDFLAALGDVKPRHRDRHEP